MEKGGAGTSARRSPFVVRASARALSSFVLVLRIVLSMLGVAPSHKLADRLEEPRTAGGLFARASVSAKQGSDGIAAVGDGDGAGAVHELVGGVDAHGGVDGGVEVHERHGVLDGLFGEFIGGAVSAAVL